MPSGTGPLTIYLTYDDGPNPSATPALLDVLRDGGARATSFLIDAHVTDATAPIVRRMFAEGHWGRPSFRHTRIPDREAIPRPAAHRSGRGTERDSCTNAA